MKRILLPAIVVITAALTGGTAGAQAPRAQDRPPDASPGSPSASSDREFINEMTIAGLAEVQLGKMASEQAGNADVKAFGQMMMKDHSQANMELAQVASRLNVQPPMQLDQKHQDLANRLSKLKGAEFDREYTTAMVQGHEEVASKLRARSGNRSSSTDHSSGTAANSAAGGQSGGGAGTTAATASGSGGSSSASSTSSAPRAGATSDGSDGVTQWASKTLPTVEQHLARARELQQKAK